MPEISFYETKIEFRKIWWQQVAGIAALCSGGKAITEEVLELPPYAQVLVPWGWSDSQRVKCWSTAWGPEVRFLAHM